MAEQPDLTEQLVAVLKEALVEHETTWGSEAYDQTGDWSVRAAILIARVEGSKHA